MGINMVEQKKYMSVKFGRKIAVSGRSMINMIEAARELNYINAPDDLFIDIDMIKNFTDEQLVIMTTGSQGETMSALTRMANGEHKKVTITGNDLVIISANPIPGNEKSVSKVIDQLMKIGAEVVYSALADVHVSGHACQEELQKREKENESIFDRELQNHLEGMEDNILFDDIYLPEESFLEDLFKILEENGKIPET